LRCLELVSIRTSVIVLDDILFPPHYVLLQ
jgi:hypothetical protein